MSAVVISPDTVRETPPREFERIVVLSIDGLRPSDCQTLPTLSVLAREGAFAAPPDGALSVLPTVTYPAHTTMVTGVNPARHGITTNQASDSTPDRKNKGGWRWYRQDVGVPTLYEIALDAGLKTALLSWPVTVGARATVLLPEYSRAGTAEDLKLIRQLATPGLFEQIASLRPDFPARYTPPDVKDAVMIDAALAVLDTTAPELMFVHIWQTDSKQHEFGPDSNEAKQALLEADAQVLRLLEALRRTAEWPRTALVIVSDHGFARIDKLMAPLVHLGARGLGSRVWIDNAGAMSFLYLQNAGDTEAENIARAWFTELMADPSNGIQSVLDRQAIAQGGGDPNAFLALEAAPGFSFSRDTTGEPITGTKKKGVHGYLPERAEMRATLLFYGPRIVPTNLVQARLLDLAPTLAGWLHLTLPVVEGRALAIALR